LQRQVAGHLEQEIRKEEQAAGETEDLRREAEIMVHLQGSHADVAAVDEGQQVADHQEGDEAPGHLAHGGRFEASVVVDVVHMSPAL